MLIRENTVRYFALTSGLIFLGFGNIKNIRHCPTNWSYRYVLITLVETVIMYFLGIFNNFLNKSDAPLSYMM